MFVIRFTITNQTETEAFNSAVYLKDTFGARIKSASMQSTDLILRGLIQEDTFAAMVASVQTLKTTFVSRLEYQFQMSELE